MNINKPASFQDDNEIYEEFYDLEDPVDTTYLKYSDELIKNPFYKKDQAQIKDVKKYLQKVMNTKIIYSSDDIYIRFLYDQLTTLKFADTAFNQNLRQMLKQQESISSRQIIKLVDDNYGFA